MIVQSIERVLALHIPSQMLFFWPLSAEFVAEFVVVFYVVHFVLVCDLFLPFLVSFKLHPHVFAPHVSQIHHSMHYSMRTKAQPCLL